MRQAPRLGDTFRGFIFHINLKVLPHQPRGYTGADRQVLRRRQRRRTAAGLPNPPVPTTPRFPDLNDGVNDQSLGKNGRTAPGFTGSQQRSGLKRRRLRHRRRRRRCSTR